MKWCMGRDLHAAGPANSEPPNYQITKKSSLSRPTWDEWLVARSVDNSYQSASKLYIKPLQFRWNISSKIWNKCSPGSEVHHLGILFPVGIVYLILTIILLCWVYDIPWHVCSVGRQQHQYGSSYYCLEQTWSNQSDVRFSVLWCTVVPAGGGIPTCRCVPTCVRTRVRKKCIHLHQPQAM